MDGLPGVSPSETESMTQHRNPTIVKLARDRLNTIGVDQLPDKVMGPVATIAIEPYCDVIRSATRSTTGVTTLYTTPADKDFYLCGAILSWTADAANDGTQVAINLTQQGVAYQLLQLVKVTLTATAQNQSIDLNRPIRIDRNTSITFGGTFGAGTSRCNCTFWGYIQETTT